MDNKEKILDLLQKEDENKLSYKEKHELELLTRDPEVKDFLGTYYKIKKALRSGTHLSYDQLYNYILLKSGNEPEDKHVISQLPLIEEHLRKCNICLEEFTLLNNEYSEIENYVSIPGEKAAAEVKEFVPLRRQNLTTRYGVFTVLIVGVLFLAMFFVSELSKPGYYKYAEINEDSDFYVTRGRASADFQRSLDALEHKNYSTAITYLKQDIKNNPNDANIFYSHYILGLTYLENSEKEVLGLFPSYNSAEVKKGLHHFQKTINLNNSGKFPNITYDSYFYIAKGYLMLGDMNQAKNYLKLVVDNKGSKIQEAQNILNELE